MARSYANGWRYVAIAALALAVGACVKSPPVSQADADPSTAAPTPTTAFIASGDDEAPGTPIQNPVIPPAPPGSQSPACRAGDPLANVHDPQRLRIVTPCVTVTGRVVFTRTQSDGDVHIDLSPDDPFLGLLNDVNRANNHNWLVAKIVPADQPGCTHGLPLGTASNPKAYGVCTSADVLSPSVGSHVAITGPYVFNTIRGWMEIHPAWAVNQVLAVASTTLVPPPPSTSRTPGTAGGTTLFTSPPQYVPFPNPSGSPGYGVPPSVSYPPTTRSTFPFGSNPPPGQHG